MGLFSKLFNKADTLGEWLQSTSDEELEDGYEERRQAWLKECGGDRTPEMQRINREINRRSAEKWEKDPHRNTDPNFCWTDANRWDKH